MQSNQRQTFELKTQPAKQKPQATFLNNLGAMRKAALEKKAKRWGFDFEKEAPIVKHQTHSVVVNEKITKTIPETITRETD